MFIIEAADKRTGPWHRVGLKDYRLAKQAYTPAREFWEQGGKTRRWVRVRKDCNVRAAHVFFGGCYKPGFAGTWERTR